MAEKELYQREATLKSHSTGKSSVTAMLCMSISNLPTTPKVWALDAPCFVMKFSILKRTKEKIFFKCICNTSLKYWQLHVSIIICFESGRNDSLSISHIQNYTRSLAWHWQYGIRHDTEIVVDARNFTVITSSMFLIYKPHEHLLNTSSWDEP